ncbi:MAG: glycosyltransferase, partial [Solirubrobacterales bacterium]
DYAGWAREAADSVRFAGRLEHDEVAALLPATDAMVVPSTFPEAFGMVAAEAAAAGVLPVCAGHSGLAEVSRTLGRALPAQAAGLLAFPVDDRAVEAIAERLVAWLALPAAERRSIGARLSASVAANWSWQEVAGRVLAGAAGELDDLPAP